MMLPLMPMVNLLKKNQKRNPIEVGIDLVIGVIGMMIDLGIEEIGTGTMIGPEEGMIEGMMIEIGVEMTIGEGIGTGMMTEEETETEMIEETEVIETGILEGIEKMMVKMMDREKEKTGGVTTQQLLLLTMLPHLEPRKRKREGKEERTDGIHLVKIKQQQLM